MSAPQLKQPLGNGIWYICWTEGRRSNRVSTRESDLAKAQIFFGQWLLMERSAPAVGANLTCAEMWEIYRAKHVDVKTAAPATLHYSWKNLQQHFGPLTLLQIDQDVVDSYERKRLTGKIGKPSKPATVRRELNTLRGSWSWCADPKRKIIAAAEIPAFDIPRGSPPRDRWLRDEEIALLFASARQLRRGSRMSRGERFLWLALHTGARKGAICDLTWDRVDWQTRVIDYKVPGQLETKKRRARVPISDALLPALRTMHDERVSNRVMENNDNLWRAITTIARHAGVKGVTPHVLRHTAASHMARCGIPLQKIAALLGNTVLMVETVYAHHCPDDLRSAVNSISSGVVFDPGTSPIVAHNARPNRPTTTDTDLLVTALPEGG